MQNDKQEQVKFKSPNYLTTFEEEEQLNNLVSSVSLSGSHVNMSDSDTATVISHMSATAPEAESTASTEEPKVEEPARKSAFTPVMPRKNKSVIIESSDSESTQEIDQDSS